MENSAYDIVLNSFSPNDLDEKNNFDSHCNEVDLLKYEQKPYFFNKEKALITNLKEKLSEFNLDEVNKFY
jgi:hypothetical protein